MSLKIETVSPEEAELYLKKPESRPRAINLPYGGSIVGSAEVTCRDIKSGEVVWKEEAKNVVTDYGRRQWFTEGIRTMYIFASPSIEAPDFRRNSLIGPYDGNQDPISPGLSGVISGFQRVWGVYTFSAPGATRYIGTVGLTAYPNYLFNFQLGVQRIVSYLLLSPAKTQTSSQQMEVIYKLSYLFSV